MVDESDWREVGSKTHDNCTTSKELRIAGAKGGDVIVSPGESKFIEFNDYRSEFAWFCGGDENRSACGADFLAVEITRRTGEDRRFTTRFFAKR